MRGPEKHFISRYPNEVGSVRRIARERKKEITNPNIARRRLEVTRKALAESEKARNTDDLTGIPNERAFRKIVTEELADPYLKSGTIIVIDLNDFKWVNDSFGHQFGDDVLIEFASVLESSTRTGVDEIARWHGDEFLIFIPDQKTRTSQIDDLAENEDTKERRRGQFDVDALERKIESGFRQAVTGIMGNLDEEKRESLIHYLSRRRLVLSDGSVFDGGPVGFGVHRFDSSLEGVNVDTILKEADDAMYVRKQARREAFMKLVREEMGPEPQI